ncbi:MAG: hypothetical protein K2I62_08345 [Alistipes sp.]|nr:hypothetical protein [Alistipes sp.]
MMGRFFDAIPFAMTRGLCAASSIFRNDIAGLFICGGWGRRIEDAGRRRWQRKALQANLRPASSVENCILACYCKELNALKKLFPFRHREELKELTELSPRHREELQTLQSCIPSVIARHRRCRGDLNKNNNRTGIIETKMFCFI